MEYNAFIKDEFIFMSVNFSLAYMYVHLTCARCLQRSEEGTGSLEMIVTDGCECSRGC